MPFGRPVAKCGELQPFSAGLGVHSTDAFSLHKHIAIAIHKVQKVVLFGLLGGARLGAEGKHQGRGSNQQKAQHEDKNRGFQFLVTSTGVPTLILLNT